MRSDCVDDQSLTIAAYIDGGPGYYHHGPRTIVASISICIIVAFCSGLFDVGYHPVIFKLTAALTPIFLLIEFSCRFLKNLFSSRHEVGRREEIRKRFSRKNESARCCSNNVRRNRYGIENWLNATSHTNPLSRCCKPFEQRDSTCDCEICTDRRSNVESGLPTSATAKSKATLNMKRTLDRLDASESPCDEAGLFTARGRKILVGVRTQDFLTIKNVMDRMVATCALAATAPLLFIIYAFMKCQTNASGLTIVKRAGWHGRSISAMHFRTLECTDIVHKRGAVSRLLRTIGLADFVRRTGLSGLPQLINVVSGELALVGPNPSSATASPIDSAGQIVVAQMAERQNVKPGLLDFAFSRTAFGSDFCLPNARERNELNIHYLTRMTPWFDAKCAGRTFALLMQNPRLAESPAT